jgi:hypothetical protein
MCLLQLFQRALPALSCEFAWFDFRNLTVGTVGPTREPVASHASCSAASCPVFEPSPWTFSLHDNPLSQREWRRKQRLAASKTDQIMVPESSTHKLLGYLGGRMCKESAAEPAKSNSSRPLHWTGGSEGYSLFRVIGFFVCFTTVPLNMHVCLVLCHSSTPCTWVQ